LSFPFKSDLNIKETAATISENYLLGKPSLENDIFLKTRAGQESFWKLVTGDKFPNLRRCSETVHSCLWICESAFSYLKMTKSKQRSNMSDEHLQDSLKLVLAPDSPGFHQMVDQMRAQTSH
jgi:hypothetical protein